MVLKFITIFPVLFLSLHSLVAGAELSHAELVHLRENNRAAQVEAGILAPGPFALSAAFIKHRIPRPSHLVNAVLHPVQTAVLRAEDLPYDQGYLVNITAGGDHLLMDFDTGSSDFWVYSTLMPKDQQGSHGLYKHEGKKKTLLSWKIRYGDGFTAGGVVYYDAVIIGGVTALYQAVEAATSVSPGFQNFPADGIVGLGMEPGNTCGVIRCPTFMHNVKFSLKKPLFTVALRHKAPGEFDFGFIDKHKYIEPLIEVELTNASGAGFWEFDSPGYAIGAGEMIPYKIDAIADTGTSLLITYRNIVAAFYAPVAGAHYNFTLGGWIFPCANYNQLPDLSFWMGLTDPNHGSKPAKHTMPGANAVYAAVKEPEGYCFGGVQENNGEQITILGTVFLKGKFVVFDYEERMIGDRLQKGRILFARQAGGDP